MRDTKSLLLLLVSLLLVVVSFVLIWTWGYSYYSSKNNTAASNIIQPPADAAAIANKVRDSLQQVYDATMLDMDKQLSSTLTHTDSLQQELELKLAEFHRLRT
ncbi:MAG: hypothetical protein WAT20_02410, partial [Ferruginibacter sp.]